MVTAMRQRRALALILSLVALAAVVAVVIVQLVREGERIDALEVALDTKIAEVEANLARAMRALAPQSEAWIVTGKSVEVALGGNSISFQVRYDHPGGSDYWEEPVARGQDDRLVALQTCYDAATIGQPIPPCMRK